ncbi:hypothetical protein I79_026176 [Cricetulus griseus]|uniref:Uncharacterized protein n=1 Tax=Cricetulus griseus TaxID=10029 RepID=G3IQ78_CRIGR|nr:hypothetical protein I79_026176 [Cricetulus griseus]
MAVTLMMPTRVVFIIKMPSVKMEMAWVSLATFSREKEGMKFSTGKSPLSVRG